MHPNATRAGGATTGDLTPDDRDAAERATAAGPQLVARAVAWCALPSGSDDLPGLQRMADALRPALRALPGVLDEPPLPPTREVDAQGRERERPAGAALRLTVRPQAPVQVALTGHYDTVYPADSPFDAVATRADGALNGPGVADMKGGLSVMLGALLAFEAHPAAHRLGYRVLISPDEETGSQGSAPLLAELGRTAHVGLTYEPALADGSLAAARKGSSNWACVVEGRAAHAGRAFGEGRNAVAAAARIAARLHALNGAREGVTVNVARIDGGGPLNVVPDRAVVRFNVRVPDAAAALWSRAEVEAACRPREPGDEGVAVRLLPVSARPPKPFNAAQAALFAAAREASEALGRPLSWADSGGVCEGNNLFAAGCPGIDTLGVRGGAIHSHDEHAWPESFGERAALSALLLARMATGAVDAPAIRARMEAPA